MLCEIVLTVSESKRLIAKGVAALPAVRKALANGTVAITPGSTNAYVVEEVTGTRIEKRKFVTGATLPAGTSRDGLLSRELPDVVLRNGRPVDGLSATDAVKEMGPGDVFIKGANALHYESGRVGVLIGHPTGGTVGAAIGSIVARRITWIVPIGLEKCVAEPIEDVYAFMTSDRESDGPVASLWPAEAQVVTEIEALETLTGVEAMQSAAGGLAGAEGAVRLVARGTPDQIKAVRSLIASIHGEAPLVNAP
jgi:hypothetical protein